MIIIRAFQILIEFKFMRNSYPEMNAKNRSEYSDPDKKNELLLLLDDKLLDLLLA